MTLTVERINEIRNELDHNLPLSIEDRNALFDLALAGAGKEKVALPEGIAATGPAKKPVTAKKAKVDVEPLPEGVATLSVPDVEA